MQSFYFAWFWLLFLRWIYLTVYMRINDYLRAIFEILVKKNIKKYLDVNKNMLNFAPQLRKNDCQAWQNKLKKQDSVAQLVEQLTLNQWVESSSLSGVTRQNV